MVFSKKNSTGMVVLNAVNKNKVGGVELKFERKQNYTSGVVYSFQYNKASIIDSAAVFFRRKQIFYDHDIFQN